MRRRYAIGIDFGTTQSYLAFMPRDGRDYVRLARCNPNPQGDRAPYTPGPWAAMPSRLFLKKWKNDNPPEFETLVADDDKFTDQYHVITRLKRVLGRMRAAQNLPEFRVWRSKDEIGQDNYTTAPPEALAGYLLWRMKELAIKNEEVLSHGEIDHITITVPAMASVSQKRATQFAARLAGFQQEIFTLEEPLAAFLYHMHRLSDPNGGGVFQKLDGEYVMVFDFGGGTCDLSLIQCTKGKLPIVVGRQMGEFGGEDIDDLIARRILARGRMARRVEFDELSPAAKDKVRRKARQLKEDLVTRDSAQASIGYLDDKYIGERALSIQLLDELLSSAVVSTRFNMTQPVSDPIMTLIARLVEALIREAGISNISEPPIKYVILAGGSSKLRKVRTWFDDHFPQLKSGAIIDTDAEACIALGAAIHQYYLHHQQSKLRKLVQPTLPYDIRLLHSRDPVGQGWKGEKTLAERNSEIRKRSHRVWVGGVQKSGNLVSIAIVQDKDYENPLLTRDIVIDRNLPVSYLRVKFELTEGGLIENLRLTPADFRAPPLIFHWLSPKSLLRESRVPYGGEQALELLKEYDLTNTVRINMLRNQFGIVLQS